MNIQQLYQSFDDDSIIDTSEIESLKNLIEKYPFFQAAIFLYLKSLYVDNDINYQNELERLSISINSRRTLFYYIFSKEYKTFFEETGKKELTEDRTSILLNAFFESRNEELTDLEYTIFHSSLASTDYLSYTDNLGTKAEKLPEEEKSNLKYQNIIDSFISKSEDGEIKIQAKGEDKEDEITENIKESDTQDELNEDVFFTETLANIYIKQKKYEKAYKIIKHLSLNYPKKNIYFADQLSFLEKLIINTKFKDKK